MDDRFSPTGPGFHEYLTEESWLGIWRRHSYPGGATYSEFTSHSEFLGFPLIHITRGVCPETRRRKTARGFIAIGRKALGFVALGQLAVGVVAIGQACLGLISVGQAAGGYLTLCQGGFGWRLGIGQVVAGQTAIGQIAAGRYVLAQMGVGVHVWSTETADPEAVGYFRGLLETMSARLGI
jgi:hypothetical protein